MATYTVYEVASNQNLLYIQDLGAARLFMVRRAAQPGLPDFFCHTDSDGLAEILVNGTKVYGVRIHEKVPQAPKIATVALHTDLWTPKGAVPKTGWYKVNQTFDVPGTKHQKAKSDAFFCLFLATDNTPIGDAIACAQYSSRIQFELNEKIRHMPRSAIAALPVPDVRTVLINDPENADLRTKAYSIAYGQFVAEGRFVAQSRSKLAWQN